MIFLDILNEKLENDIKKIEKEIKTDFFEFANTILEKGYAIENIEKTVEVYLFVIDDEEMKKTNFETRGNDRATDVLSFPMYEKEEILDGILSKKQKFPVALRRYCA